jgi:hypothetical protein
MGTLISLQKKEGFFVGANHCHHTLTTAFLLTIHVPIIADLKTIELKFRNESHILPLQCFDITKTTSEGTINLRIRLGSNKKDNGNKHIDILMDFLNYLQKAWSERYTCLLKKYKEDETAEAVRKLSESQNPNHSLACKQALLQEYKVLQRKIVLRESQIQEFARHSVFSLAQAGNLADKIAKNNGLNKC